MNIQLLKTLALFLLVFNGLTACVSAPISVPPPTSFDLATKHTSVFNKIDYRIPRGWVVVDGESDWVAPSVNKQFWQPDFDPAIDAYYVVSEIFPHLTLEDFRERRVRPIEELANATLHSLSVAAGAEPQGQPNYYRINNYEAVSFLTKMTAKQSFYQVFIKIADDRVASVAGGGPSHQLIVMQTLVDAIAETVVPSSKSKK